MVIRLCEVGFRRCVTSVAEAGLRPDKEVFGFLGVVRRVTVQAPDIVAGVWRSGKVPLFVLLSVAAQAARVGVLFRNRLEIDDL